MDNIWFIAAIWMGLAFLSSLISIRTGISVALIEIVVGKVAGNISIGGDHHILKTTEWTHFLGRLAAVFLTGPLTTAFAFALFHSGGLKAFATEWRLAIGLCGAAGFFIALVFWLAMRRKIRLRFYDKNPFRQRA